MQIINSHATSTEGPSELLVAREKVQPLSGKQVLAWLLISLALSKYKSSKSIRERFIVAFGLAKSTQPRSQVVSSSREGP